MPTKFIDNKYIERFADGDSVMKKCLKQIKDILLKEANSLSDDDRKALDLFTYQKAIHLDDVKERKKLDSQSADIVSIIGDKEVLIADAKLNASGGSSLYQNQGKKAKGQYSDSIQILKNNPNFSAMGLEPLPDLVIILPSKDFEVIKNKMTRCNLNQPQLLSFRIKDFFEEYFDEK